MIKLFQKIDLPFRIIISLKALLLYLFFVHRGLFVISISNKLPYLPFLKILDTVPSYIFSIAGFLLLFSIFSVFLKKGNYQVFSLVSGLIVLMFILSSKLLFSNSLLFVSCLLILIGLYRGNTYIFRIQISLLYLGAGINKFFDPDWWNGHYFDFFLRDVFQVTLYSSMIPVDHLTTAQLIGIATIVCECLLGIIVLIPKLTRITIFFGLIFHFAMLLITSGELSARFFYIMCTAFLLISNLNIKPIRIEHPNGFLAKLLSFLDLSDSLIPEGRGKKGAAVSIGNECYTNKQALFKLMLSTQSVIFFFFTLLIAYMIYPFILKKVIIPALGLTGFVL